MALREGSANSAQGATRLPGRRGTSHPEANMRGAEAEPIGRQQAVLLQQGRFGAAPGEVAVGGEARAGPLSRGLSLRTADAESSAANPPRLPRTRTRDVCLCAWSASRRGCQCADLSTASLSGGGHGLSSIRPGGIQAGWLGPVNLHQRDPRFSSPRLEARKPNSARRGVRGCSGEAQVSFSVSCHHIELSVC